VVVTADSGDSGDNDGGSGVSSDRVSGGDQDAVPLYSDFADRTLLEQSL
jgi:hypothetical protein